MPTSRLALKDDVRPGLVVEAGNFWAILLTDETVGETDDSYPALIFDKASGRRRWLTAGDGMVRRSAVRIDEYSSWCVSEAIWTIDDEHLARTEPMGLNETCILDRPGYYESGSICQHCEGRVQHTCGCSCECVEPVGWAGELCSDCDDNCGEEEEEEDAEYCDLCDDYDHGRDSHDYCETCGDYALHETEHCPNNEEPEPDVDASE